MGRLQNEISKITGTFEGLTFYNHKLYGILVRRKGGPSRRNVKTGEKFVNTRRQNSEFGAVARANKMLRIGLQHLIDRKAPIMPRLQAALWQVMKADTQSAWGERTVAKALSSPKGKQSFEGYEFIADHPFMKELSVQFKDGQVKISWLKKSKSTTSSLCLAITVSRLGTSFKEAGSSELKYGTTVFLTRSPSQKTLTLPVPALANEWDFELTVLQVTKARQLRNDIIVKDDAPCSLRLLRVEGELGRVGKAVAV